MTHICTFGIQPASMDALAAALFGDITFQGKLPVSIPGEAAFGHGLTL
jgi:beta-N-acetylhexosaminidase